MTIWRGTNPLILASQSRARKMLLANAGLAFEAIPADIDERAIQQAAKASAPGEVAALRNVIETLRATIAEQNATIRSIQDEKRTLLALITDRRPWWRRWFR